MTTLRIFANETQAQSYEWVLFDNLNSVLRQSKDALNSLPAADEVEVIIPTAWVSFTPATLPAGNRKRLLEALPYLIEEHLVASPEQVHVVIAETKDDNRAILASIDKQLLTSLLSTLQTHNIQPNRVIPASLITRFNHDSWSMVCESEQFFLRNASSSGISLSEEDDGSPPLELLLAVQQAKASQSLPEEILVYGAHKLDLADWSAKLGVHLVANSSDWKRFAPKTSMNFLQGSFAPASQGWAILEHAKPALLMLAGVIALALIGSSVDWARKSYEKSQLDQEMKALFLSAFPETTNIVDAPLQMQRKLSELQHASGEANSGDFLVLLANISTHANSLAKVNAMHYQDEQLVLSLQAANEEAARALAQKTIIPGRITVIENIQANAGAVNFDLVFKADGE